MKALGKGSIASFVEIALTIAWYFLWVCLGALVIASAGYAAAIGLINLGILDPSRLPDAQREIPTWHVVVLALVIGAVVIVGALVIVGRLRRLFKNFTSGEPFRRENADHLRVIWITMLTIEIARYVLMAALGASFAVGGLPEGARAEFKIDIDLSNWMSIAILIVLAEVFREGARLKEEQELTI